MLHFLKSIEFSVKIFNCCVVHQMHVQNVAEDLSIIMHMQPIGFSKHTTKCDFLAHTLSGKDNAGVIDRLTRHVIFWITKKLEARRGTLCELTRFDSHVYSKEGTQQIILLLMLDEDYGVVELDTLSVYKSASCEAPSVGRMILVT